MNKITVKWNVSDGYVNNGRTQETEIDINDFFDDDEWNEMSKENKQEEISSIVEDDFRNKISFEIDDWGI